MRQLTWNSPHETVHGYCHLRCGSIARRQEDVRRQADWQSAEKGGLILLL